MSNIKVNPKLFKISSGKSWTKYVKEVENSRNNNNEGKNENNEMFHHIMKRIVRTIAKNVDWDKLKNAM